MRRDIVQRKVLIKAAPSKSKVVWEHLFVISRINLTKHYVCVYCGAAASRFRIEGAL